MRMMDMRAVCLPLSIYLSMGSSFCGKGLLVNRRIGAGRGADWGNNPGELSE